METAESRKGRPWHSVGRHVFPFFKDAETALKSLACNLHFGLYRSGITWWLRVWTLA